VLTTHRHQLARAGIALALLVAVVVALGSPSSGEVRGGGASCPPEILWCSYGGGGGGSGGGGGGGGGGSGGGGDGTCAYIVGGVEYRVACYVGGLGFFNATNGCYYLRLDPQPPLSDPIYEGHTPGSGAVYRVTCYTGPPPWRGAESVDRYWIDAGAPAIDPVDLAFAALAKIRLDPADIHTAPSTTGVGGLVGLPVWMWTPRTAHTWGPLSDQASAGPLTVFITATAARVVWNMGDGHTVTCTTPGTRYAARYGGGNSPDCGYTYTKSSRGESAGNYTITATTTWHVAWHGGGQSGVITVVRVAAVNIQINEAQVVVK
jgi:hypothetical protein